MRSYLQKNGFIRTDNLMKLATEVRDRDDINVWKCLESGVIFLDRPEKDLTSHYQAKEMSGETDYAEVDVNGTSHITLWQEDDQRRADAFRDHIRGNNWMDVGAGEGGVVDLLSPFARSATALELNTGQCARMRARNLNVTSDLHSIEAESLDVISLFHVMEHFEEPIEQLAEISTRLKKGGKIIVEVPHARDFLIETLDNDEFKNFTFWSEHLILHTRHSLEKTLRDAGFDILSTQGVQRYHLGNHLYWAQNKLPGGHGAWSFVDTPEMKKAYENMLCQIDQTDTLTTVAVKKGN